VRVKTIGRSNQQKKVPPVPTAQLGFSGPSFLLVGYVHIVAASAVAKEMHNSNSLTGKGLAGASLSLAPTSPVSTPISSTDPSVVPLPKLPGFHLILPSRPLRRPPPRAPPRLLHRAFHRLLLHRPFYRFLLGLLPDLLGPF